MGDSGSGSSFLPLPGAPTFHKAPEVVETPKQQPQHRPMSMEVYGFARRMEELFQPLGPKKAKHTFSESSLNEIESRPPEAYLAKPPRVKQWNQKKAKLLNFPGLRLEQQTAPANNDKPQRWSQECVTVSFTPPSSSSSSSTPPSTVSQVFSMELTSNQIKTAMFELAGIEAKVEDYELRIPAINHVVPLDNLALQTFIQACLLSRISPLFEVVPKSTTNNSDEDNLKKHIQTELEIFELVGLPLARTLDLYKPEVIASRRALAALRLGVTRSHHTSSDSELQQFVYVDSEPLPLTIPNNVSVLAQLPINAIRITVSVDPNQEVDEARNKIFRKFSIIDKANSQGKSADDYVLKATGFREYLLPNNLNLGNNRQLTTKNDRFKLIDYDFIRKRISKSQQIELTLVDIADLREQIAEAEGESIIDHLLCAEFDNEQAQAQQVINGKLETNFEDSYDPPFPSLLNTRPIPTTKMHRSFRIKACCVRDTRTAREDVFAKFKEKEKGDPSIYVKMELFHGGQSISPVVLTPLAPAPVNEKDAPLTYPQWDEWRVSMLQ